MKLKVTTNSEYKVFGVTIAFIMTIVSRIINASIEGLALMIAWNAIAWNCNLPQFAILPCIATMFVVDTILQNFRKNSRKD